LRFRTLLAALYSRHEAWWGNQPCAALQVFRERENGCYLPGMLNYAVSKRH